MEDISFTLLFFSVFAGYLLGIISGLLPGIHNNNFALALVAFAPFLAEKGISPFYIAIIIISNSVAQTFHDIIPSIFLGAPDGDTALAVLPGHRLLLDGAGAEAVRLSALGSAGSVVISLLFVIPISLFFKTIYPYLEEHMALILISIVFLMLISEKGADENSDSSQNPEKQNPLAKYKYKFYALLLFLITGVLGLFAFSKEELMVPIINFGEASALLPLLSGLFGASQLIISLMTSSKIPEESVSALKLSQKSIIRGIVTGSAAGSLVAWLPGLSSAIAALLAGLFIKADFDKIPLKKKALEPELHLSRTFLYTDPYARKRDTLESSKEFIISMSGVNTSNAIFGLVAFVIIGRTRSGAMVAVEEILGAEVFDFPILLLFFAAMVLTALFSYFSTVWIGNNAHHLLKKINYTKLCACVLAGLGLMVLLFTGPFGFFIFVISTPIGMLASFMNVRKSHAMGVILLPVILYFI
ncbi:MAG: tripartite tricarboxylate transporter permease [Methanosarcina sp.]